MQPVSRPSASSRHHVGAEVGFRYGGTATLVMGLHTFPGNGRFPTTVSTPSAPCRATTTGVAGMPLNRDAETIV
ncbi:MAG: hypothetical protein VYA67_10540 [Actinomycetota bacterium]|uniref:Uncharacterized protein n=1 Tax=Mycobacterium lentiflavum TaxID=141349 RepID=A0ABY3UT38_MYCLN|nr:hypothetical protein [Mycobacterium lentiflavum]MEE3064385.1 hypothetical protein [Actinomycetota bacterium]ULP40301.1 hypothetical protein MJO58_14820 [Mycobacterium lentiflavum]